MLSESNFPLDTLKTDGVGSTFEASTSNKGEGVRVATVGMAPSPFVSPENQKTRESGVQGHYSRRIEQTPHLGFSVAKLRHMATHKPTDIRYKELPNGGMARLCKAKDNTCNAPALKGQLICSSHGGQNPNTKRGAQARLAALVDPAIAGIWELAMTAKSEGVRLNAYKEILERAGAGAPKRTEVTQISASALDAELERLARELGENDGALDSVREEA